MALGPVSSSIPFNLARAYGIAAAPPVAAVSPATQTRPLGRIGAPDPQPQAPVRSDAISQLVAAIVPGKVDFSGAAPAQRSGSLPFYSRPGEQNEAAVNIRLGRSLDIEG
jgi:hypothetical protein